MPVQAPQWTDYLSCLICYNEFEGTVRRPISLACGHTMCKSCLSKLQRKQCPFDQAIINVDINQLPENYALLQLVGGRIPEKTSQMVSLVPKEDYKHYLEAKECVEDLALYLKSPSAGASNCVSQNSPLSRPMLRKLVTLINCQFVEEEGRSRGMRTARSLGERSVTELILQHQNPQQLSANLWAAVRARGCQFLGPAMQEEVLKLVLLALEDGSALSRKVLVMFVVQRLAPHFPQASKTSIGHVVQLLYRASCFKVSKREGDSSLMQLKEEFRTYEALRREHDAQIVQIATEAGLRIAPEQWSSLLYGDTAHKSHMQSIIDKLQTPQSFSQSVQELVIALQRTGDPGNLSVLRPHLELLASIDQSPDAPAPSWEDLKCAQEATRVVVKGLVEFVQNYGNRKLQEDRLGLSAKYKTSMCRDLAQRRNCPRGLNCTFAHSQEELEKFRAKSKRSGCAPGTGGNGRGLNPDSLEQQDEDVSVRSLSPENSYSMTASECAISKYTFDGSFISEGKDEDTTIENSTHLFSAAMKDHIIMAGPTNLGSLPLPTAHMLNTDITDFQPSSNKSSQLLTIKPSYQTLSTTILGVIPAAIGFQPTKLKLGSKCISQNVIKNTSCVLNCDLPTLPLEQPGLQPDSPAMNLSYVDFKRESCNSMVKNQYYMLKTTDADMAAFYSPWAGTSVFPYGAACSNANLSPPLTPSPSEEGSTSPQQKENSSSEMDFSNCTIFCPSEKDEFIPFDPPLVSKYGPISRCSKNLIRGPAPIQVNAVSQMGELTNPTSVVCHPLPSASFAPSYPTTSPGFAVPVAILPEQFLPVVESGSVMLPVAVDCTVCISDKSEIPKPEHEALESDMCLKKDSDYYSHLEEREISSQRLREELWEIEKSLAESKQNWLKEGAKYLERPCRQNYDLKVGGSVPTSIGPWPSQTLENIPYRASDISSIEPNTNF